MGFNDKFWFDRRGRPHTEQLRVIERWTRIDLGHFQAKTTIDDPGAYTKPFTLTFNARMAPGDELLEVHLPGKQSIRVTGWPSQPVCSREVVMWNRTVRYRTREFVTVD